MLNRAQSLRRSTIVSLLLCGVLLAACGSSKKSSSTAASTGSPTGTVNISVTESGGAGQFTAPSSIKGGLVTITLKNQGKQPHNAQLILIKGNHTAADVVKQISGNSPKTPSWLRAEGGVGLTLPGQSSSATVNLGAGHYGLLEVPTGGPPSGKPASTDLQVTAGPTGSLPSTSTRVTAATSGKDKYKWQISGPLHSGSNQVTFASKGHDAIHLITAVQITGNPSKATLLKALESNSNTPPPFIKFQTATQTAALDGGKTTVTQLNLAAPGRYVLFCPITDRDGGKPHFAKGLLTTITVK